MKKPFGQSSNPFTPSVGRSGRAVSSTSLSTRNQSSLGGGSGGSGRAPGAGQGNESFREFGASELYCPKCGESMPVKERPLLYLPTGGVSDYKCARCGTILGTKRS